MFLFRALNEYDILSNPLDNGLASKRVINDIVENYYKNRNIDFINQSKEKKIELIKDYLISHNNKLEKKYYNYSKDYIEVLDNINKGNSNNKAGDYIQYEKILSTIQSHLITGSKIDTNWISTSKELYSIKKYYEKQNIHNLSLGFFRIIYLFFYVKISLRKILIKKKLKIEKFVCQNRTCSHVLFLILN